MVDNPVIPKIISMLNQKDQFCLLQPAAALLCYVSFPDLEQFVSVAFVTAVKCEANV